MQPPQQFKLTPFEWTMSSEFVGSAVEFVIRLCCSGEVETKRFEMAITEAIKQQPLLQVNASIGPTHSSSYWRPASNLTPAIRWFNGVPSGGRGETDDFQPIDLDNEIGFRFYGWQFQTAQGQHADMRFVFHHACCDGKGASGFIESILCHYQTLLGGACEEVAMPSFDGDRISLRDRFENKPYSAVDRIRRNLVVRPRRAANMLLMRPMSIHMSPDQTGQASVIVPRQCSVTLDKQTTQMLGRYADSANAATNLVLARELFIVLGGYLASRATGDHRSDGNRFLRMLIPYSLRDQRHRLMPAANCVSIAYLELKLQSVLRDPQQNSTLLPELVEQFEFIKKWQLQYSWIETIKSYARIRALIGPLRRGQLKPRRSKRQIATTVLSNLGKVFSRGPLADGKGKIKVGSLEVETVHLMLPCTEKLIVNFSVNFYRDCLTLDVSYLPSKINQKTAQALLDSWQARILKVAKARPSRPSRRPEPQSEHRS